MVHSLHAWFEMTSTKHYTKLINSVHGSCLEMISCLFTFTMSLFNHRCCVCDTMVLCLCVCVRQKFPYCHFSDCLAHQVAKWYSIVWFPLFIPFIYSFILYWEARDKIRFYKLQCDCGQTVNTTVIVALQRLKRLMNHWGWLCMFSASFLVGKALLLLVLSVAAVPWRANMQCNSCKLFNTYRIITCLFCIAWNKEKFTPSFMLLSIDTMPGQYNYRYHCN